MPDVKVYYALLAAKQAEIEAAALNGTLPEALYGIGTAADPLTRLPKRVVTHLWITSLDNWEKNSSAGATLMALPRVAATRILDATHRVATIEEVEAEKARQAAQKEQHDRAEGLLNKRHQISVRVPEN
jgi:hypothetical protein